MKEPIIAVGPGMEDYEKDMNEDSITYTAYGGRDALDMRREDLNLLMLMLGYACGAASERDDELLSTFNSFVSRLRDATTAKS